MEGHRFLGRDARLGHAKTETFRAEIVDCLFAFSGAHVVADTLSHHVTREILPTGVLVQPASARPYSAAPPGDAGQDHVCNYRQTPHGRGNTVMSTITP
jgi:hypothetical protein